VIDVAEHHAGHEHLGFKGQLLAPEAGRGVKPKKLSAKSGAEGFWLEMDHGRIRKGTPVIGR